MTAPSTCGRIGPRGTACIEPAGHNSSYGDGTVLRWLSPNQRRAPELSLAEAAKLAEFEAAEPAPESYVQQHVSEATCWCGPQQVGTLGVWTHR